jgi:DNA mismatch repair protein MutS
MGQDLSPIRQQYLKIKRRYPQAIVFFRLGDFYETFDDDAKTTSRELEIVLTSRGMGKGQRVPMAGIPYHALDEYLSKLIKRGYKVAICEQMTKPGETKGIVEREVVRLVTPGTVVEPGLLSDKANNYLASLVLAGDEAAIAYVDITTSEFTTTQLAVQRVASELERLKPAEIVVSKSTEVSDLGVTAPVTRLNDYQFELEIARRTILDHFGAATLDGYGCSHLPLAIQAAGAIIYYLKQTQKGTLEQLSRLSTYSIGSFMELDKTTIANLELFHSTSEASSNSLLKTIDLTRTAMGGRLLKRWLSQPLLDIKELEKRQEAICWFYSTSLARKETISLLGEVADLERLINRVRSYSTLPRELVALKRSLQVVPRFIEVIQAGENSGHIDFLEVELKPRQDVIDLISEAIEDEPSSRLGEGGVIRRGFSEELDSFRRATRNAKQYLADLEFKERERSGIKSLKVGFNKIFGYYIEISQSNLAQVPEDYIRKQTLVGGERFITPQLKEYESMILNASDRLSELETSLFRRVCYQVAIDSERILALAHAIAKLDVFSTLAEVAVRYSYVRPKLTTGSEIVISQGRHPVVERSLIEHDFVPNDVELASDDDQLIILTGPNMAGKSTYIKQVALIVLLAQIGSFVPTDSATIGLVDRVFTRVGAREDLAAGQSTFMVEMIETANILNHATPRSLLILDEIGRGTSTYDGLAIARAVAEYIHNYSGLGAKTLFATHYHEMVELASYLPRVRNFNIAVTEEAGEVIFLRKIVPGGVDKSYGIHVAKLAGLPKSVLHRANEVLDELEEDSSKTKNVLKRQRRKLAPQLSFFNQKPPVLEELEKLDTNALTPLEALTKLYELQKKVRDG